MILIHGLGSFLGGATARMVWGEVSQWFTNEQEARHERDRMLLQKELDAGRAALDEARIRMCHELDVHEIPCRVESEATDPIWSARVAANDAPSGFRLIDAWNKAIRPAGATVVFCLWVGILATVHFKPSEWDLSVMGAILGFFYADRSMGKKGK